MVPRQSFFWYDTDCSIICTRTLFRKERILHGVYIVKSVSYQEKDWRGQCPDHTANPSFGMTTTKIFNHILA